MEWIIMSDELEHSGKPGMRWGQRNYQRKDGTWTPLGLRLRRIREGSSGSKRKPFADAQKRADRKNEIKNLQSKAELESAKAAYKINKAQNKSAIQAAKAGASSIGNKIKDAAKKASEARKEKKREESVEEIVRSGDMKKILSSKDKLTEDELRTAVNRLRLEQDLKDVNAREKARGQETFKKFANTVGDVANLTKSGIDVYNNIAKVINAFTDKDLKTIGGGGQESAYTQAMNAARLRTAQAAATTAEVNARRSLESESGSSGRASANAQSSSHQQSSNQTNNSTHDGQIRPNDDVNRRAFERAAATNARRALESESGSSGRASANAQSSSRQQSSNSNRSAEPGTFRAIRESYADLGYTSDRSLRGLRNVGMRRDELRLARTRVRQEFGTNSDQYERVDRAARAMEEVDNLVALRYRTRANASGLSDTALANAEREVDRLMANARRNGVYNDIMAANDILARYREEDD